MNGMVPLGSLRTSLGEGPIWDDRRQRLWIVDIEMCQVHELNPTNGATRTWQLEQPAGAVALTDGDELLLAVRDGFAGFVPDTGVATLLVPVQHASREDRLNDGACDRLGRFWAGSISAKRAPVARLFRLDHDLQASSHVEGVTVSNGIGWSLDDRWMYYVDTPTRRIDKFEYDLKTGTLGCRSVHCDLQTQAGKPDGLVVDAQGVIWVAMWGGGAVLQVAPDGRLCGRLEVPVPHPTKVGFGGPDLRDLFITTAAFPLSPLERVRYPDAGAVFTCRPDAKGQPVSRLAAL
jgi:sugar lactone lactonase YvrE